MKEYLAYLCAEYFVRDIETLISDLVEYGFDLKGDKILRIQDGERVYGTLARDPHRLKVLPPRGRLDECLGLSEEH